MKCVRAILLLVMFSLIINSTMIVSAESQEYPTRPVSMERKESYSNSIRLSKMTEEPQNQGVECFDINEDGLLAVGFGAFAKKEIAVYSLDGVFQYGYKFHHDGEFGLEWEDNQIVIYFIRGDFAVTVTAEGEVVRVAEVLTTVSDSSYQNHPAFATKRIVNDKVYVSKNSLGFLSIFVSGYSQIEVTDSSGNAQLVYDVEESQKKSATVVFVSSFLFVCVVLGAIIRGILSFDKNEVLNT